MNELAFCSLLSSETCTSCRVINAFCTTRRAILFSIFSQRKPGVSFSTTKPLTWLSSVSRAQITVRSAKVALPIHFFWPLSTQQQRPLVGGQQHLECVEVARVDGHDGSLSRN